MKRPFLVIVPITVTVVMIITVAIMIFDQSFPAGANRALQAYIAHLPPTSVKTIVPSKQPWHFTSEMSQAVFGEANGYFQPDFYFNGQSAQTETRPLPYPPQEAWCVSLQNDAVVLVSLHEDLYVARWFVHEVNLDGQVLPIIGCA